MMWQEYGRSERFEVVGWPVVAMLFLPLLLGCSGVYIYKLTGGTPALVVAVAFLAVGLLASSAFILSSRRTVAMAASGAAMIETLALFLILVPRSGFVYADVAIVFAAVVGVLLLHGRWVEMPSLGPSRIREASVGVVLFLPLGIAVVQALFLGLRFWESFPVGKASLLFIPLLAIWSYAEEGLFRGVLQRSVLPLMGVRGSIVLSATLYAGFTLFWGSVPYAIFSFLFGLLLGWMYLRSRSLMYVGTIHALADTWMIIAYLGLDIVIP